MSDTEIRHEVLQMFYYHPKWYVTYNRLIDYPLDQVMRVINELLAKKLVTQGFGYPDRQHDRVPYDHYTITRAGMEVVLKMLDIDNLRCHTPGCDTQLSWSGSGVFFCYSCGETELY